MSLSITRFTGSVLSKCVKFPTYRVLTIPIVTNISSLSNSYRQFSSSVIKYNNSTKELKDIITSELKFEQREPVVLEKFHEEWLSNSGFTILEKELDEVATELVKETESEIIHVYFNPLEVTNIPLDSDYLRKSPPEDDVDNFAAEESTQNMQGGMFDETIANVTVIVEKKGDANDKSGLYFNLLLSVQTNYFAIGGLRKFEDIKLAMKDSAQDEFERESAYYGPPFTNLDEYLQDALMDYLNSRGIDNSLGDFISGYSLVKENEMYLSWLNDLKSFF